MFLVYARHPVERVLLEGADGDAADAGGGLSRGEESRVLCQVMADRIVIYTDPDPGSYIFNVKSQQNNLTF